MSAIAVDSSAIIAIINGEAEADLFFETLLRAEAVVGWPTILEVRLWLNRRPQATTMWLDALLTNPSTRVVSFGQEHERLAARADALYGKGRHTARLNFGDCMAYAVAVSENLPLLFKGGDFGLTDVAVHPASVQA